MKKLYDIILFICSIALCVSALWLIAIIYDGPNEIHGSCKKLPKKYNIVWVK